MCGFLDYFFFNAANQKNYMRTLQFSHTVSSADLLLSLGEREPYGVFKPFTHLRLNLSACTVGGALQVLSRYTGTSFCGNKTSVYSCAVHVLLIERDRAFLWPPQKLDKTWLKIGGDPLWSIHSTRRYGGQSFGEKSKLFFTQRRSFHGQGFIYMKMITEGRLWWWSKLHVLGCRLTYYGQTLTSA